MSSFNILLFACVFYLVQGRPEPITNDEESQRVTDCPPPTPVNITYPHVEAGKYQQQVDGLLKDMVQAMDKHMLPLMSQLDEETQKELLTMAFNGFSSYLNYVILLIQENKNKDALASVPAGKILDQDEIIVEFDELQPKFDSGFIAAVPSDSDQESEIEIGSEAQSEEVPDTTTTPVETEPETESEDEDYATAEAAADSSPSD